MTQAQRLLLMDAYVLIDFANAQRDALPLIAKHVGRLHVTPTVFQEVTEVTPNDAVQLGLTIIEPSLDALASSAQKRGRLSFEDRLTVSICKECSLTCVSNDTQLRLECERQNVLVMWGLDLLAHLVRAKAMAASKGESIARKICSANHWLGPSALDDCLKHIHDTGADREHPKKRQLAAK